MLRSVWVKCDRKQIRKVIFLPLFSLNSETRIAAMYLGVPLLCVVIPIVKHRTDLQSKTRIEKNSLRKSPFSSLTINNAKFYNELKTYVKKIILCKPFASGLLRRKQPFLVSFPGSRTASPGCVSPGHTTGTHKNQGIDARQRSALRRGRNPSNSCNHRIKECQRCGKD